jgi:hypothetical protein
MSDKLAILASCRLLPPIAGVYRGNLEPIGAFSTGQPFAKYLPVTMDLRVVTLESVVLTRLNANIHCCMITETWPAQLRVWDGLFIAFLLVLQVKLSVSTHLSRESRCVEDLLRGLLEDGIKKIYIY